MLKQDPFVHGAKLDCRERESLQRGSTWHISISILLRQGSVTGVILVGRPDSLGFHSVTWLVGF